MRFAMTWEVCKFHIMLMIVGYVLFLASAVGSIIYLILKRYSWTNKLEELRKAILSTRETQTRIYLAAGFIFLTFGLLTGSLQAKKVWGSYWNWDSKQIGSLLVWLYYGMLNFISLRMSRGTRKGAIIAIFSLLGISLMILNYLVPLVLKTSHRF